MGLHAIYTCVKSMTWICGRISFTRLLVELNSLEYGYGPQTNPKWSLRKWLRRNPWTTEFGLWTEIFSFIGPNQSTNTLTKPLIKRDVHGMGHPRPPLHAPPPPLQRTSGAVSVSKWKWKKMQAKARMQKATNQLEQANFTERENGPTWVSPFRSPRPLKGLPFCSIWVLMSS